MAEEEGPTSDWPDSVPKPVQEFREQWKNLPRKTAEELNRVLLGITCLPYGDGKEQARLFEKVKQLQPFHIIRTFDLGVLPLQKTQKDPSKFLEEVHKLFDYCLGFCYNPNESQRVFFEFYSKILEFCFPSESEQALQVEASCELLKLVQQLQVGKIGEFQAPQSWKIHGTLPLFDELLSLFQHRRQEEKIVDIIAQTAELVSLDAKASNFPGFQINQVLLPCKQAVSPVFRNWMQLLKFTTVSNGFIVRLFKTASLSGSKSPAPGRIPGIQTDPVYNYEGLLFLVVEALQEMETRGENIELPNDRERLQIFFNLITDFGPNSGLNITMLKLLACTSISNKVLREVVELFAPKGERSHDILQENACIPAAFDVVSKVLILLPEGKLVMKVLEFCKDNFHNLEARVQALSSLLRIIFKVLQRIETFDKGVCLKKESERVAKFVTTLSPRLLLLDPAFESVVSMLIQIFPCSFEQRQGFLDDVIKKTFGAGHSEQRRRIVLQCLVRLMQKSWSENVMENVVRLFLQHPDLHLLPLIESLCLCQQLSLGWIGNFLVRLSNFFNYIGETEKNTIACFVLRVASDQRTEYKEEILSASLETLDLCWDENMQTFASDTLPTMALIERLPLSRSTVLKVLELSKDRSRGLPYTRKILQLINVSHGVLNERCDEYFDFLLAAVFKTLEGEKRLCDPFFRTLYFCLSLSGVFLVACDLLFVCGILVSGLLSLGLFRKEIDLRCLHILMQAKGLVLPHEHLQFYFKTRSAVFKVMRLLRNRNISFSTDCLPPACEIFLKSWTFLARSDVSSSLARVLLTDKVCNMVLSNPGLLMYNRLAHTLANLLPYTDPKSPQHAESGQCAVLSLSHFEAVLEQPAVLEQLGRIPANAKTSVVKILSSKCPGAFSADNIMQVFSFMASFKDVHQSFFYHFLSLLEVITRNSASARDIINYLEEVKNAIMANHLQPELIPLAVLTFAHLVDDKVEKEQREAFTTALAAQWMSVTISSDICTFLEIPNLLWQAHKRAHLKGKTIAFIHKIFQNDTEMTTSLLKGRSLIVQMLPDSIIRRKILCRDLEWLALHSSLSHTNVALVFRFCLLSSSKPFRCLSFSDVVIEESKIKLVPHQRADENGVQSCATNAAGNQGATVQEQETSILTPGLIGYNIVKHLQRLQGEECNLRDSTEKILNALLRAGVSCTDRECRPDFIDDYAKVFLSILEQASSVEVVSHWGMLNCHHVTQCLEVIIKTCEWCNIGEQVNKQAHLELHAGVRTALEELLKRPIDSLSPFCSMPTSVPVPCFRLLNQALREFIVILEKRLPLQQTQGLLKLAGINPQAAGSTAEIICDWSNGKEAERLLTTVQKRCEGEGISSLKREHLDFVWQLLRECSHICRDSSQKILEQLDELITRFDLDDEYGLNRLPIWRESMINKGFSARAVNSWCLSFFLTPIKDLTSRDVDAIVDLNPSSLKLVSSVSNNIGQCIFPESGFPVNRDKGIKEDHVMVRLRRARILGEFITVLRFLKPETSKKDDVVRQIVLDACDKLFQSYDEETSSKRITRTFYKIHGQALKSLFTEVFGKKRFLEAVVDVGGTTGAENVERRVARQLTSYLHENLPQVLKHGQVYEPMVVLLRRWMTSIVNKPVLASHIQEIVQLPFSSHSTKKVTLSREPHDSIQEHVLSLERNQALIAQLQASGYNATQRGQIDSLDLWTSPSFEFPCYLSNYKGESPDQKRWTKKLTKDLRPLWSEWRNILFSRGISKIKVGETDVHTRDLFAPNASLSEMESQVAAIKELTKQDPLPDRYMAQLIRREQQLRSRIEKLRVTDDKDTKTDAREKVELKKFVAVWENRFLENVVLCSNRIPGCYAPNGFHSEKPALCAVSVDNRILTVFKEEKGGRREEMENVEVKLFDAGMYVYGLHSSGHDYDTDQLWTAFFKMLLEKRLVPRIVLNNESPGFDWIKNVVKPTSSLPNPWKWHFHCGIVPPEEDYFDYDPFTAVVFPPLYGLSEFITLTKENVAGFQFRDLKDFKNTERKEQQARNMCGKAINYLEVELNALPIQENDDKLRKALVKRLANRLANAVRRTVQQLIEGEEPSCESVMTEIDKNKLSSGYPQILQIVSGPDVYANKVIAACKKAQGEVAQSTTCA